MSSTCRVCNSKRLRQVLDLGRQPIANGFLTDFKNEFFYDLKVAACADCRMVQLVELVPPEKLFHDEYPYFSSSSQRMQDHFKSLAEKVLSAVPPNPFIVEIGSNDGVLLKHFARIQHLGIEPSANVDLVSRHLGLNTWVQFFSKQTADTVVSRYGQANIVVAANTFCHIPDLNELFEAINILLAPNGVLVFEDPYLGDILDKVAFDQFYDEHVYYFSIGSVRRLLSRHNFSLRKVERLPTHGGSMRYWCSKGKGISDEVNKYVRAESNLSFHLRHLQRRTEKRGRHLLNILKEVKRTGQRVVGYGATSKSTTLLNYFGIGPDLLDYVVDTTPAKQGKFTPGTHIPIVSRKQFLEDNPDMALLLAWNHQEEILEKEESWLGLGKSFITYVPKVKII